MGLLLLLALAFGACRPSARSRYSYDEIKHLVAGKTAAEVERILGRPNVCQAVLLDDERCIWWSYTFLDGAPYAPELRGKVVHLEIIFEHPAAAGETPRPTAEWRVSG